MNPAADLTFRACLFDLAGLVLICSILLYFTYIRWGRPWMAQFAFYMFLAGGVPLVYFFLTGYFGS